MVNAQQQPRTSQWSRLWRQGVVVIVLVSLMLSVFNMTYISMRGIYLQYVPGLVRLYDPLKGIDPHPITQHYLARVSQLRQEVSQAGLLSAPARAIVRDLEGQSISLLEENPYIISGQANLAAKLNRRMRGYVGTLSAKDAFRQFWTVEYLDQIGWESADEFFQKKIEPLLQRSYFRETLPTGQFVDEFWRIDLWFVAFFGVEFLGRTFVTSRQQKDVTWRKAIVRRWYELPLVLPFWRWMRIVPLLVGLHRTDLFKVEKLIAQMSHEPVAYLSEKASQYLLVQLISQTQDSVHEGTLFDASPNSKVVIGDRKKVGLIADQLIKITILRVVPTVRPEIEDLLRHSLERALTSTELYESLRGVPGLNALPDSALDSVANYLAQATCTVLEESYADREGQLLIDRLSQNFRQALRQELQDKAASQEIQVMLIDLLEEIKVNYVQGAEQRDPEQMMNQVDSITG